jgi:hypothetical protein
MNYLVLIHKFILGPNSVSNAEMSNFSQGQGQFCRIAELDGFIAARKDEGHGCPESNQGTPRPALRREQVIPQIDPGEICAAFHRASAEIAEKGHFWMETNS